MTKNTDLYKLSSDNVFIDTGCRLRKGRANDVMTVYVNNMQILDGSNVLISYQCLHEKEGETRVTPQASFTGKWDFDRPTMTFSLDESSLAKLLATGGAVAHVNGLSIDEFSETFTAEEVTYSLRYAHADYNPLVVFKDHLSGDLSGSNVIIDASDLKISTFDAFESSTDDANTVTITVSVGGNLEITMDTKTETYGDDDPDIVEEDKFINVKLMADLEINLSTNEIRLIDFEDFGSTDETEVAIDVAKLFEQAKSINDYLTKQNILHTIIELSPNYQYLLPVAEMIISNEATSLKQLSFSRVFDGGYLPNGFRINLTDPDEREDLDKHGVSGHIKTLIGVVDDIILSKLELGTEQPDNKLVEFAHN